MPTIKVPADTRKQQQAESFRLLVASVRDYAIFLLDTTGRIQSWNEGARRIKGYTADEIIGKHFSIFYPPRDVRHGKPHNGSRVAADEGRDGKKRGGASARTALRCGQAWSLPPCVMTTAN